MILPALFFYLFAGVCVASAAMVITSRNPVHSVLFLILAFVNAAGLFILLGAEFLAMILIVVYVGAVAVLFLFVIMMLVVPVRHHDAGRGFRRIARGLSRIPAFRHGDRGRLPWTLTPAVTKSITAAIPGEVSNTEALGLVLYTKYIHYFQLAGMVLLVAMIGAIVLTLRHRESVKRQDINVQNARTPEMAMRVRQVASGQGLQDADAAEWVK
ncbi:MAG: NADH dehydrogenase subunit J [Nitrobacter sp.]|uniref:NADH-quinone oxidoreductase subunit J n=1 Tax=Nitrobacter sp. TaxID=29420 RepID=UPI00387DF473